MAVSDWSTTPDSNTAIDGVNIAEGCAPGNINNAIRRVMASVRVMYDGLPVTSTFMPKGGGVFTGPISYTGRGGYLHHNDPALTSGKVFVQAIGGATPTMADGDILIEY